ncbi:hypothetical protein D5b_00030 [Faustovirus]|nr:hypothetical protein D5b_00030 [Faustovirus]AMN84879.1 hypothetical protein D6_00480 [Faustovirus]AMP43989.1 hypothetical protein PRJ_Dakar_00029 [Faustovirus]
MTTFTPIYAKIIAFMTHHRIPSGLMSQFLSVEREPFEAYLAPSSRMCQWGLYEPVLESQFANFISRLGQKPVSSMAVSIVSNRQTSTASNEPIMTSLPPQPMSGAPLIITSTLGGAKIAKPKRVRGKYNTRARRQKKAMNQHDAPPHNTPQPPIIQLGEKINIPITIPNLQFNYTSLNDWQRQNANKNIGREYINNVMMYAMSNV